MPHEWIDVRGARVHNLKDVNVKLPRNQLVVVTGLSGSGKSSLAFDTIYAEGQRRYVESLSAYARQFLEQVEKPDVDQITGLSPAISIEQRTTMIEVVKKTAEKVFIHLTVGGGIQSVENIKSLWETNLEAENMFKMEEYRAKVSSGTYIRSLCKRMGGIAYDINRIAIL